MEGWIKLYRKLLDNPIICKDSDYLSVWIYLLLVATHNEYDVVFKGKRITLEKGQLITGTISISEKLKIDKNKVQRILKSFENDKQIEQQTSNRNRLITILNWDKFQDVDKQFDKQVINNRETDDKQVITNKNVKNIKNVNNEKNKKEINKEKIHFAEFVSMTNAEYEKLISTYGKEFADQCIKKLDNYKGSSNKKYASDYRAILSWVVDDLNSKKNQSKQSGWDYINNEPQKNYDEIYEN